MNVIRLRREKWDRIVSTACTGWPRGVCGPGYPRDHDECRTPRCACPCHAVEEIEPPAEADR